MDGELICTCSCGTARVVVTGRPLTRFRCHCTICQATYRQPFADATVLWARDVPRDRVEHVRFGTHRKPPAAQRGVCPACGDVTVAYMTPVPFLRLAFVPVARYPHDFRVPEPALDIFYDSRVEDVDDGVPKYPGYWPSQLAVLRLVLRAALRRGR
ncbi:MAG: hypothetical protein P8Y52_11975 [Xanthomonadales bacterium]